MKKYFLLLLAVLPSFLGFAGDEDSLKLMLEKQVKLVDSINSAMRYETGVIKLKGGMAQLNVPKGFKFLNGKQSQYVLNEVWGNPPRPDVLGMIFPENANPFTDSSYVFVVTYDESGYVKDDDADEYDYDQMLKDEQAAEPEINKERAKEGYPVIHFIGWAQKPFYDKNKKVLHWAKELRFGASPEDNTLNYEVRILGRKGVLSLNAISSIGELKLVKADIDKVLNMATFTEGNAYKDFDPGVDKVAAWTIGGLVAGKVLAKVGLFAVIGKFLVAGWKFILIGLVALGGFFKKLFTRKKENKFTPAPVEEVADTASPAASVVSESNVANEVAVTYVDEASRDDQAGTHQS